MHFKRTAGGKVVTGVHRNFFMDGRFEFKFKLYKRFMATRQLKWTVDMPVEGRS